MELEKSPDYFPIDSSSLRADTKIGCDLYLLVKGSAGSRYILYCRGDAVFENSKSEMLLEKNISRLFIKKDDQQKYYEYLETNFQNIISDTRLSSDEKTKIVHSAATNLVKDLFNDPRSGSIERTKTFAYNMVDFVLKDSHAAHSLLKIAVHEYYTYTHSVNVASVGTLFAKSIGLEEDDLKGFCSGILLHDIGKTRISTDILNKKGKLTKEEIEIMKKHPELGAEILNETGIEFKEELIITLQHHENDDGSGYPNGLNTGEIHLSGKIARIIDVYDALTTKRSYADAVRPFAAIVEMNKKMLHCFDKELFKEFIQFLGPYDPRKEQRTYIYA
ncbi:MAG: HD domain-containing protein [Candidatus Scalindua sp.]|jgi:putative nucleotidyltransferase with HDIG domain|nr:HD domain-containing protein [Candidatus Scalindua sp.]MBT5307438.1 HD domain-containing protein [Candidatus Scalindua sp.]MBT6561603.1 HD domain-containing protein [Candidatus Scalindua sp.]MBT7212218.1 HD domain-containing protein [Candidatus Scalindua sp.]MBT7592707.1 HD domain-containing protein [Candidatus Scalindua sp.]